MLPRTLAAVITDHAVGLARRVQCEIKWFYNTLRMLIPVRMEQRVFKNIFMGTVLIRDECFILLLSEGA